MHDGSGSAGTQALLRVIRNGHRPFQVVVLGAPAGHRLQSRMGFMPSRAEGTQDLERQTSSEEEAVLSIAYTTLRGRPSKCAYS
jgi:hypothetical protein